MKQILELKESSKKINSPKQLFDNIKKIDIDYSQENMIIIFLNTNNEIINSEIIFKGGLNCCIIDPKTIFRKALLYNASSIIMAHNHPSENLEPSSEDVNAFSNLKKCGELLKLSVLDSIVFNKTNYYSMV